MGTVDKLTRKLDSLTGIAASLASLHSAHLGASASSTMVAPAVVGESAGSAAAPAAAATKQVDEMELDADVSA